VQSGENYLGLIFTKYYFSDKINEDEMRWTYRMHGGEYKCINVSWENLRESDHLQIIGLGRRIILKWILNGVGV
jgi:hypothetical protein